MANRIIFIISLITGTLLWLFFTGKSLLDTRKAEKDLLKVLSRDLILLRAELDVFKDELDDIKKKID